MWHDQARVPVVEEGAAPAAAKNHGRPTTATIKNWRGLSESRIAEALGRCPAVNVHCVEQIAPRASPFFYSKMFPHEVIHGSFAPGVRRAGSPSIWNQGAWFRAKLRHVVAGSRPSASSPEYSPATCCLRGRSSWSLAQVTSTTAVTNAKPGALQRSTEMGFRSNFFELFLE